MSTNNFDLFPFFASLLWQTVSVENIQLSVEICFMVCKKRLEMNQWLMSSVMVIYEKFNCTKLHWDKWFLIIIHDC